MLHLSTEKDNFLNGKWAPGSWCSANDTDEPALLNKRLARRQRRFSAARAPQHEEFTVLYTRGERF